MYADPGLLLPVLQGLPQELSGGDHRLTPLPSSQDLLSISLVYFGPCCCLFASSFFIKFLLLLPQRNQLCEGVVFWISLWENQLKIVRVLSTLAGPLFLLPQVAS